MLELSTEQISTISELVAEKFLYDSEKIIVHLNTTNKLDEFLKITSLKSEINKELNRNLVNTKKVIVVGQGLGTVSDYRQCCRNVGINPENFEFHLDYYDGKNLDFNKFRYKSEYGGIIVGAMPHSGKAKGKYSSVIDFLENEPGFPMVVRSQDKSGKLKLCSSGFTSAVLALFNCGAIALN